MKRKGLKLTLILAALIILYIFLAILPYVKQPDISEETRQSLNLEKFCAQDDGGERAKIICDNGEALEERIRLISQAEEEIILSTFRFESDDVGKMVLSALRDAAKRGVKIYVLSDGFSYLTTMWGDPYFLAVAAMDQVEFRQYNPIRIWKPWTSMARMHDKYLIVDRKAYILGGRNTFGYFLGDLPGHKNYDWDIFVYKEEKEKTGSMEQLLHYFYTMWDHKESAVLGKSWLWKYNPSVKKAGEFLDERYQEMTKEHQEWFETRDYVEYTLPLNHAELLTNPVNTGAKEPALFFEMTELMKQTKSELYFHTPYVICDDWMMEQLQEICSLVPSVEMLTNSIANNGNPFGAMDYSMRKQDFIDTGLEIHEYDGGISYHGKCFTMDDRISGIGSFNWDMRSAYMNTEMMLVIDSPELTRQLNEMMETYEKDSLIVEDLHQYQLKPGQLPQELSKKKASKINIIKHFARWARFLF